MKSTAPLLNNTKIIIIFETLELGGAERQGLNLAQFLKTECGADIQVWGLYQTPGRLSQLCEECGIPWRGISFKWPQNKYDRLKQLAKFINKIRRERADILLPYTWLPNVVCGLTWKFSGVKTCIWNQRDEGIGLNTTRWHRSAIRMTPYFISNSQAGKDFLIKTYGLDSNKFEVIHNGISIAKSADDRSTWRRRLNVGEDHFLACMVANLHHNKDHITLLRSWKKIIDTCRPKDLSPVLLLAGRFDNKEHELKALAFDLELGNTVRFLGKINDVSGLLNAVDICVHSSKSEGCPNAVLEAMAAGLPVVGTDIPGIRETISPVGYTYLTKPEDSDSICTVFLDLMLNKTLRQNIGNANRRHIEDNYSLSGMCHKTAEHIARVLGCN